MAMKVPRMPALLKEGYKMMQGVDEALLRNIEACKELGTLVKTSYGPNGMNKMVINHLEKLFVTNDAATIMRELEVTHPAARLIVMASQQMENEVGDATNWVVIFASELLNKAAELLKIGVHSADIIEGYEVAAKKVLELLEREVVSELTDVTSSTGLLQALRSALGSKQYGYDAFLADLVAKACIDVMPKNPKYFSVDSVRVVKVMGASVHDSMVVRGMVFNREPESELKKIKDAKVAIYTCGLDIQQTETKGTVLLKNADELLSFSKGEEAQLEGMVKEIAQSGVKVIVVGSGVGDLALHFANKYGLVVVKCLSKFDLRRLCKVTGAVAMTRLGAPTAEEAGHVDQLDTIEIGSDRCTVFQQNEGKATRTITIVLRGATQNHMDDLERAIDDGVNTVKLMTKDGRLLRGAGCVEISLAKKLVDQLSSSSSSDSDSASAIAGSVNAMGVMAFAEAFEVIPRTLADNAGLDSTSVVSTLYSELSKGNINSGVNVEAEFGIQTAVDSNGDQITPGDKASPSKVIRDITKTGDNLDLYPIYDPYVAKYWAIKYAVDAALTVLRVDQIIMSKPAGGPKLPKGGNQMYDDDQMA
ncbi:hypothetical protein MIR68_010607 [Amoeboaphelidium protococcarum]|nr:hypothetical protein MIR68_010607 [Amoeboaphelidium protococcarum]